MRLLPLAVVLAIATLAPAQTTQAAKPTSPQPKPTIAEKIAASQQLLDINTASPAQLKSLPGMGNAYVKRIVDGRPYTAKNQLVTRGILPRSAYDAIKDRIIAHRTKH